MTAVEARAYCGSYGADLAAISGDPIQIEFLHEQVVVGNHEGAYWVGLRDVTIEGLTYILYIICLMVERYTMLTGYIIVLSPRTMCYFHVESFLCTPW